MKFPLLNYTYQVSNIFGIDEKDIEARIEKIQGKHFITNPILGTLARTFIGDDVENIIISNEDLDLMQTRLTGHVLSLVKAEIENNNNYKQELKKKLLSSNEGQFSSAFNEIFVGGYLKYLKYEIKFSSSKEKGKPDIEVIGENGFSSDVKTFPDMEFWLEDQLDCILGELVSILNQCKNFHLIIFVSGVKNFKKEVLEIILEFLKTGKDQRKPSCSILNMPGYAGNQGYWIDNKENNVVFRFIPSFAYSMEELSELMSKAIKQQQSVSCNGITWLMFPHPKPSSIERRVIWEASGIPQEMQNKGVGLALYEIFPQIEPQDKSKLSVHMGADFLIDKKFATVINRKSFDEYVSYLLEIPTIVIK